MPPYEGTGEGTGTWPDYLVNRDEPKNEGPFGEELHGNREIVVE